jgi:hypothetical protein
MLPFPVRLTRCCPKHAPLHQPQCPFIQRSTLMSHSYAPTLTELRLYGSSPFSRLDPFLPSTPVSCSIQEQDLSRLHTVNLFLSSTLVCPLTQTRLDCECTLLLIVPDPGAESTGMGGGAHGVSLPYIRSILYTLMDTLEDRINCGRLSEEF